MCKLPLGKLDAVAERTPIRASRSKILTHLGWCQTCADEALAECAEAGLLDAEAWFSWGHTVLRGERPPVCSCHLAGGHQRGCAHAHGREAHSYKPRDNDLASGLPSGDPARGADENPASRLLVKHRRKNPSAKWNGHALAHYLNEQVIVRFWGKQPGPVNIEATRQQISRWIHNEGMDPQVVKAMIDYFVSTPTNLKKGTPAWRTFISQRHTLAAAVSRISRDTDREAQRGDRESWRL